ncbi:hypothetical protein [Clavibacter michiganensis]|uniref:Uncharacterized protein n=1 Tax=Clavibacter michiganensis TaxID=28447 RepID=A0A251YUH5_9MICO|nr:hypothetical protein [Clavibacter michiganensis]OUE27892.1 hypothetical protein BFL37_00945 [Clavibacter michiganensis]
MDEAEAIARADRLWESGRRAAALESLRTRVRREPADAGVRRALVGRYRELGAADQAGRYGLAIGGLTTRRERQLAARQFAASWTGTAGLADFLALPAGDLPSEVLDLVVEVERLRQERRLAWGTDHAGTGDADDISFAFWAVTGTLLVLSLLAAVVVDLAGAPWTALARWIAVAVVAVMLIGCGLERRRAVRSRLVAAAEGWGMAAVVLALGLACLVAAAVAVS